MNGGWGIFYEIVLRWMPPDLTDDKLTVVQIMAWCRQAPSHYLSQCCPDLCRQMASLGRNEFWIIYLQETLHSPFRRLANTLLSGVPDYFGRNKILSGYDLSHYQVPHCILRVFFYFVWFVFIHHNFQFYFELCTYCDILDIYLS